MRGMAKFLMAAAVLSVATARADTIPVITQQPVGGAVQIGGAINLQVNATGSSSFTYQWYRNGTPLESYQSSQFYQYDAQPGDVGSYTVSVTNQAGTVMSMPAAITVNPSAPPPVNNQPAYRQTPGVGSQLNLYEYLNLTAPAVSQWYKDGQPIAGGGIGTYQINSVAYSDSGTYVNVVGNSGGSTAQPPITVTVTAPSYPYSWLDAGSINGIAYFVFSSPAQVLRYDMNAGSWLAPVQLNAALGTPTAMKVLPEGLFIAFGRTTYVYGLDLASAPTAITNTPTSIQSMFADASYLYLQGPSTQYSGDSIYTSINRSTLTVAVTADAGVLSGLDGIVASPTTGLAYGFDGQGEPSQLYTMALNADGTVVFNFGTSPTNIYISYYNFPSQPMAVSPDGSELFTQGGAIYNTTTLQFYTSLGLPHDDLCFLPDGAAVTLQGPVVRLFSPTSYVEQGSATLASPATRIFANGTTVYAFSPPAVSGGAITVATATESEMAASPRAPFPSLSPSASAALGTSPDGSFMGTDGNVYLLSNPTGNILRWSPSQGAYLQSIPLTGIPLSVSYSTTLNRIYTLYPDRRITKIDLGNSLTENPFTVLENDGTGMVAAGDQLLVFLSGAFTPKLELFSSAGAITSTLQTYEYGNALYWDGPLNELIFPYDFRFSEFSVQGGAIGTINSYDFSFSLNPATPFRFSADGSFFVDGAGLIYSTSTFAQSGVLGNSIADAAWLGTTVYSISNTVAGSELDAWTPPNYLKSSSAQLSGPAGAIWALSGSSILAFANTPSGPQFSTFDGSANLLTQSSPAAAPFAPSEIIEEPVDDFVAPGGTAVLSVQATGTNLSYTWYNQYYTVVGTGPTLTFADVSQNQAGSYHVVVTGGGQNVTSDQASVVVSGPPIFSAEPSYISYPTQYPVYISVGTVSLQSTAYQWFLNGQAINGDTSAYVEVNVSDPTQLGTYTVTATNSYGVATSTPVVVAPPSIVTQPQPQSVDASAPATFEVVAAGSDFLTYPWNRNGTAISGAPSSGGIDGD
jgi:hypothetical protein